MATRRLELINRSPEEFGQKWVYEADEEEEVTEDIDNEAQVLLVAEPGIGKSPVRIRKSDGTWVEVGT